MPHKDSTVYVRFPGQAKNPVLHPTTVTEAATTSSFTARPEDLTLPFEVGLELMLYFEFGGKFVQQPARVESVPGDDPEAGVTFKTIGEWVSAENRQTFRVSTVMSDLDATIGSEKGCALHDVSVTGFAVIARAKYQIGQVIDAELPYQGKTYTGQVSIQSVRERPDGSFRYGVNCVKEDKATPTCLSRGVRDISMAEQRARLSRLSRSA